MLIGKSGLSNIVESLNKLNHLSLDTETTGLEKSDRPFSIIISDGDQDYYFNLKYYPGLDQDFVLGKDDLNILQELFNNEKITWFIHNASFDLYMLRSIGLDLKGNVSCTYMMARLKYNAHYDKKPYSLDVCAKRELGKEKSDEVKEYINEHGLKTKTGDREYLHYDQVPLEIIQRYAELDARIGYELGMRYLGAIPPESLPVYDNEMLVTKAVVNMEKRGILLDKEYTIKAKDHEQSLILEAKRSFLNHTGEDYNNTVDQMVNILMKNGEQILYSAKGNPKLDDENLSRMQSPIANIIRELRFLEKRSSTYYTNFLYYASSDGRIRPSFNQSGTETGRFSSSNPNIQNLSNENTDPNDKDRDAVITGYNIRKCLIPLEGNAFVSIDFKQQEFRLLLDYAGEKKLIKDILDGADPHQATADIVGCSRKQAKTIVFGLIYGLGSKGLADKLGVPVNEANNVKNLFFSKLPKVEAVLDQIKQIARNRLYVRNWFGRRLHITEPRYSYISTNHLIQGGGADIIKKSIVQLDSINAPMIATIHDEIIFEVPLNHLELVHSYKGIMEDAYTPMNGMTMAADVQYSLTSLYKGDMKPL